MIDKKQIVTRANAVGKTLTSDFAHVKRIVDENDIVYAVWQDAREENGVGTMTIKGLQRLRTISSGTKDEVISWSAIPCADREQAQALKQVAGEQDRRH